MDKHTVQSVHPRTRLVCTFVKEFGKVYFEGKFVAVINLKISLRGIVHHL